MKDHRKTANINEEYTISGSTARLASDRLLRGMGHIDERLVAELEEADLPHRAAAPKRFFPAIAGLAAAAVVLTLLFATVFREMLLTGEWFGKREGVPARSMETADTGSFAEIIPEQTEAGAFGTADTVPETAGRADDETDGTEIGAEETVPEENPLSYGYGTRIDLEGGVLPIGEDQVIAAETKEGMMLIVDRWGEILEELPMASFGDPVNRRQEARILTKGKPVPVIQKQVNGSELTGLYDGPGLFWSMRPSRERLYMLGDNLATDSEAYVSNGDLLFTDGTQVKGSGSAVFRRIGNFITNGVQLFDLEGKEVFRSAGSILDVLEITVQSDFLMFSLGADTNIRTSLAFQPGQADEGQDEKVTVVISRTADDTLMTLLDRTLVWRESSGLTYKGHTENTISWTDQQGYGIITDLWLNTLITEPEFYARNPQYSKPLTGGKGIIAMDEYTDIRDSETENQDACYRIAISSSGEHCICTANFEIMTVLYIEPGGTGYFADSYRLEQHIDAESGNYARWADVSEPLGSAYYAANPSDPDEFYKLADKKEDSYSTGISKFTSVSGITGFGFGFVQNEKYISCSFLKFRDREPVIWQDNEEKKSFEGMEVFSNGIVRVTFRHILEGEEAEALLSNAVTENGTVVGEQIWTDEYYLDDGTPVTTDEIHPYTRLPGSTEIVLAGDERNVLLVTPEFVCSEEGNTIVFAPAWPGTEDGIQ